MKKSELKQIIKEELNKILKENVDDDLTKLFDELVPPSGKADTLEGEMVRAINRVWYRYTNDGDYYFKGYGKETAGDSAKWLTTKSPLKSQLRPIFSKMRQNALKDDHPDQFDDNKDPYLNGLRVCANVIVKYVKSKKGNYTPNEDDSR